MSNKNGHSVWTCRGKQEVGHCRMDRQSRYNNDLRVLLCGTGIRCDLIAVFVCRDYRKNFRDSPRMGQKKRTHHIRNRHGCPEHTRITGVRASLGLEDPMTLRRISGILRTLWLVRLLLRLCSPASRNTSHVHDSSDCMEVEELWERTYKWWQIRPYKHVEQDRDMRHCTVLHACCTAECIWSY